MVNVYTIASNPAQNGKNSRLLLLFRVIKKLIDKNAQPIIINIPALM